MEVTEWVDMRAKNQSSSHTHTKKKQHKQTKQTHIQQLKNKNPVLFFAAIQLWSFREKIIKERTAEQNKEKKKNKKVE